MAVLTVGPSGAYTTIAAAVAAAHDGDVVQVQAGTYTNDFVHVTSKITIEGVGGTVHMVATIPPSDGKAIMTVDADATVSGIDFSGAQVADGNGAGIRYEGGNLTLENCSFHDNQDGLLSAPVPGGQLTINNCTFTHNGSGNGYTHNLYVGDIDTLTVTNSTFTDAVVGHEIKSRAQNTIIKNNTIADGPNGTASYSIDLPDGGNALIQGNTIEKGPNAENQTIIHYGGEGIAYSGSQLTISGNTVTNELTDEPTIFLTNSTPIMATLSGNTFLGTPIANYASGPATLTNNHTATGAVPDTSSTDLGSGGNTVYITDDADHTVTLPQSFMGLEGGAGRLTAMGPSHETVLGGAGGLTWTGQGGADQIYTHAGSTNTLNLGGAGNQVQSLGTDVINLGPGNNNIEVGGTATLTGATGNNAIAVDGTAVITGTGVDRINVGAKGNAAITESNVVYINSNGGTFSLSHKTADEKVADQITVSGGASLMGLDTNLNVTTAGGSQGAHVTLGTGSTTLLSGGADTISAGTGAATVILTGSARVNGSTGALNVFGRSINGLATVYGGAGAVTLDGDTGNILLQAPTNGAFNVTDRLSHTTVVGGAGLLTVATLAGTNSLQGGAGGMVLNDSVGGQSVTTAKGSRNTINLAGGSTVVSNGTDQIHLNGDGNYALTANGAASITAGSGNSSFVLNGADVVTAASNGINGTTVGAGANVMLGSRSNGDDLQVQGGTVSYAAYGTGGSGSLWVSGWSSMQHWASSPVTTLSTSAGHATMISASTAANVDSNGADTIVGGAGVLNVNASGAATVDFGAAGGALQNLGAATVSVLAGAGAVTVSNWSGALRFTGGAGTADVAVYAGNATVSGGAGNITLGGGNGMIQFHAGAGNSVFTAGSGGDIVTAGSGAMTVNAGNGHDVLSLVAGQKHGNILVNNFDPTQDNITLTGYGRGAARATSTADGTLLKLSDGTTIQFAGVSHLQGY